MTKARYAAFHPGKIGDALYALPFIRFIYGQIGEKLDFFTSDYCEPMRSLFEYQHCINSFNIAPGYKIERMDMGCQPPFADIKGYEHVFQLGFQRVPDRAIHQFIAKEQGVDIGLGIRYDYPEMSYTLKSALEKTVGLDEYICIAPRGNTSFGNLFDTVAQRMPAVIIGGAGDYRGYGVDLTQLDFLETTTVLSRARGFIGLMSSQLVLANGFDYPRIAPWDGSSWDMRHVCYTEYNHYPVNPSTDDILKLLKG